LPAPFIQGAFVAAEGVVFYACPWQSGRPVIHPTHLSVKNITQGTMRRFPLKTELTLPCANAMFMIKKTTVLKGETAVEKPALLNYILEKRHHHFRKELNADEHLEVTLTDADDFRLFIIVPVEQGFAPIGLTQKFISPRTLRSVNGREVELAEGGELAYVDDGKLYFVQIDCRPGEKVRL